MFADFVQAAAINFTCADECEALVFEGKQFYRAFQRASITITSAGDVTFEGDAFSDFTNTGDIVISAAGSLMFNGRYAFSDLAIDYPGRDDEWMADFEYPWYWETSPYRHGALPLSVVDEQSSGPVVYSGDIILSSGGDLLWLGQRP